MATNRDYYDILGLSKSASLDDIKKAYRKLAMQYHPDRAGKSAEGKFKEVNEAYQILSDPQKRAAYDQFGHAGVGQGTGGFGGGAGGFGGGFGQGGFAGQQGAGGFDFSGFSGFGGGGLGSIFEDLFEGAFSNVQAEVAISIPQAVLGDEIHFQTQQGDKLKLKIPPGIHDGAQFRFRGKGAQTRRGRGDLIISVRIQIPRKLSREQKHLYEQLKNLDR